MGDICMEGSQDLLQSRIWAATDMSQHTIIGVRCIMTKKLQRKVISWICPEDHTTKRCLAGSQGLWISKNVFRANLITPIRGRSKNICRHLNGRIGMYQIARVGYSYNKNGLCSSYFQSTCANIRLALIFTHIVSNIKSRRDEELFAVELSSSTMFQFGLTRNYATVS